MCAFLNSVLGKGRGKGIPHAWEGFILSIFPLPGHRNTISTWVLAVTRGENGKLAGLLEDGGWSAEARPCSVEFIITVEVKENSYLSKAWSWDQVYS